MEQGKHAAAIAIGLMTSSMAAAQDGRGQTGAPAGQPSQQAQTQQPSAMRRFRGQKHVTSFSG